MAAFLILLLTVTVCVHWCPCYGQVVKEELLHYRIDPLDMNGTEPYTNLTIDQIIMKAMGGKGPAQNLVYGEDGTILAELDMRLTKEQFSALYEQPSQATARSKRKAVRDVALRWPRADVAYKFIHWHFNHKERYMIRAAMTEWEKYTCLKFRESNSSDNNMIQFQNGMGCNSQLGMVGGRQSLNLDKNGCRFKGLYLHEIGHAIGLVHEHQLPNRDDYIEILYHNVEPNMRVWFNKYSSQEVDQMRVPYEYSSVMHYGVTAFSSDGKSQTIRSRQPDKEKTIGRVYRKELSFTDVKAVSLMYHCADHCSDTIVCNGGGFVDQNCKCICPDGTDACTKPKGDGPSGEPNCYNAHDNWQCLIWANQGECTRNPRFMLESCQKACKLCGDDGKEEGKHITTWAWQWLCVFTSVCPRNWTVNVCKDVYETSKCDSWKERGECIVNRKWMEQNCKLTCKACDQLAADPETACSDVHKNSSECEKWAAEGECQINPDWMPRNCRKSCHMCLQADTPEDPYDTPDTEDTYDDGSDDACEDRHNTVECKGWADKDECRINPDWMIPNCRKSCKKCRGDNSGGEEECKNIWDDQQCEGWARDAECMKNSDWMWKNCYKACKHCEAEPTSDTSDDRGNDDNDDDDDRRHNTNDDRDRETSNTDEGTGSCVNHHRNEKECETWAKHGHCNINKWMLKHCAKACLQCTAVDDSSNKPNTTPKPRREDTEQDIACTDSDTNCQAWADYGFCEDNPLLAFKICKKACNACNGGSRCFDKHQLCPVWQKVGQCEHNSGYMLRHCQKSCGVCD